MLSVVLKIGKKMKPLTINTCNSLIFILLEIFHALIDNNLQGMSK